METVGRPFGWQEGTRASISNTRHNPNKNRRRDMLFFGCGSPQKNMSTNHAALIVDNSTQINLYHLSYCSYYEPLSSIAPIVLYAPYSMFFFFFLFTWYKRETYFAFANVWCWVAWHLSNCVNVHLGWQRYLSECSLPLSAQYSFPCPNNIYIASVCGVMFVYSGGKYRRSIRSYKRFMVVVFSVIYPVLHYTSGLGTLWQSATSYMVGFVASCFVARYVIESFVVAVMRKSKRFIGGSKNGSHHRGY
jgi:hypothetical protein